MKKKALFLIFIVFFHSLPFAFAPTDEGYGEDETSLGQFVDSFENSNNVSVAVNVIQNATLDCMELNETDIIDVSDDIWQLREHKRYAAWNPAWSYSIANDATYQISTVAALGYSYQFLVFNRNFINGTYFRWRWRQFRTLNLGPGVSNAYMFDGTYDRTNNTHFPDGAVHILFGNGQLQLLATSTLTGAGWSNWVTDDVRVDVDGGTEENTTLLIRTHDAWNAENTGLQIDWFEVNEGAGGTGTIYEVDFNASTNIVMEQVGTFRDYGYVNNTDLPIVSGGYEESGYFTTDDYMNSTNCNGTSLVLMVNTSIPANTDIQVQFSEDNATWGDWEGTALDSNILSGGFESIDLRYLNDTDVYLRFNLTSDDISLTPRVYQARIISTIGNSTGGGAAGPSGSGAIGFIMLILISSPIIVLFVWRKKK